MEPALVGLRFGKTWRRVALALALQLVDQTIIAGFGDISRALRDPAGQARPQSAADFAQLATR